MPHISGPLAEFLGSSLGIAAVLMVAGWLTIRWQQDRRRFQLMQIALEKGITRFPDAPPFWLVSMRQGLTMLALGASLVLVGGGASWLGRQVQMPATASSQFRPEPRLDQDDQPDRQPDLGSQDNNRPSRPDARFQGDDRRPRIDRGPDGRPGPDGPPGRRPNPPAPNPEMERWHQAQIEQTGGVVSIGIGIILVFVGVVRVIFAQAERQYTVGRDAHDSTF